MLLFQPDAAALFLMDLDIFHDDRHITVNGFKAGWVLILKNCNLLSNQLEYPPYKNSRQKMYVDLYLVINLLRVLKCSWHRDRVSMAAVLNGLRLIHFGYCFVLNGFTCSLAYTSSSTTDVLLYCDFVLCLMSVWLSMSVFMGLHHFIQGWHFLAKLENGAQTSSSQHWICLP